MEEWGEVEVWAGDKKNKNILEVLLCPEEMEPVRRPDEVKEGAGCKATGPERDPVVTAYVPVVEKKYPISQERRATR